jgi:hypothetical protein
MSLEASRLRSIEPSPSITIWQRTAHAIGHPKRGLGEPYCKFRPMRIASPKTVANLTPSAVQAI